MAERLAVVTGASAGLGLEVARALLARGWAVLGVARRGAPLEHPAFTHHRLDLGDAAALEAFCAGPLAAALAAPGVARLALVNDAAVLGPVGPLRRLPGPALAHSLIVNVAAPLRLMGALLDAAGARPLRVVNVSSGAATRAYAGWTAYCAGKAALRMASQVAGEEAARFAPGAAGPRDLAVVSYEPGVVDTAMQAEVRAADAAAFPAVARFHALFTEGKLVPAAAPAAEIAALCDAEGLPAWCERRHGA